MEGATPFFGAKISLISKSEIRYEGVLYTIDPKESTIALAKVRSFGTENRQADRPVPPRDEIFEFIIFRASDIKDLVVDDAPGQTPAQQAPPAFEDPAIVKSTPAGGAGPSSISAAAASSSQASSSSAGKPTENGASQPDSTKKSQQSASSSGAPKPAWGGMNALNSLQNNVQQQQPNRNQNRSDHNQQQQRQPRQYNQQQNMNNFNNQRQGVMGQRGGFRPHQGPPQGFRGPQGGFGPQGGQRYNNNNRMGDGQRSYGRGGMRGMGGGRGGHYQSRNAGPIKFAPLPDGEFDFEKAHSDFQMLEEKLKSLKLNGGAAPGEEPSSSDLPPIEGIPASAITVAALEEEEISSEPCYNKSTSFFDNISCEAVEREKGTVKRVDWKAERSLNKETFGVSSARPTHQRFFNNNRNGGGRFHNGGGYGGGYNRGRGGYNNRDRMSSNRDRVPAADQVGA